ncbi:hypothetical protein ACTMU2_22120 [Cupriavidus basilensis]
MPNSQVGRGQGCRHGHVGGLLHGRSPSVGHLGAVVCPQAGLANPVGAEARAEQLEQPGVIGRRPAGFREEGIRRRCHGPRVDRGHGHGDHRGFDDNEREPLLEDADQMFLAASWARRARSRSSSAG